MARKIPNAPTKGVWLVGIIIGLLGILAHFVHIDQVSEYNYWMLLIGFALLAIGTSFRGT